MIQGIGILIGGQSRRMGRDKSLLQYEGRTFVETIVRIAEQLTSNIVLLGQHPDIPESLHRLPQLPDQQPNKGPIAALHSLLTNFPNGWSLMLPCDTPLITKETLDLLMNNTDPNTHATVFADPPPANRLHPTTALYHPNLLPAIAAAICADCLSLTRLVLDNPHTLVPTTPAVAHALTNINTTDEYQSL